MIYVTSDIHGEYDKFIRLLDLISFNDNDFLYIIGDVVDRGNQPIKILQYIINKPNIELLLGNHEDLLLEYVRTKDYYDLQSWFGNGGQVTYSQLFNLPKEERFKMLQYLRNRSLYKVINKYILCHSGIVIPDNIIDINEIMQLQSKEDILWSREEFFNQPGIKDYTIIFGHTPTIYMYESRGQKCEHPLKIWHDEQYKDKIGIDCGATFDIGQLACIRLDDMEEFYI
jgi:serine/threonine protein phosphatase 1